MIKIWVPVNSLPNWKSQGGGILRTVCQVKILAVNEIISLWQIRRIPMMGVWNHLHLQVCGVRLQIYSFLTSIMFIYDVGYYNIWCWLYLFSKLIVIIFVVISVYVMYGFSIRSSGADIPSRKKTVWSWKIVNKFKLRLSGSVWYEENLREGN